MTTANEIGKGTRPLLANVLFWDALEREWRIGHARRLVEGGEVVDIACTVEEAHTLISDGYPVPVFTRVTHWARLPDNPGEPA